MNAWMINLIKEETRNRTTKYLCKMIRHKFKTKNELKENKNITVKISKKMNDIFLNSDNFNRVRIWKKIE